MGNTLTCQEISDGADRRVALSKATFLFGDQMKDAVARFMDKVKINDNKCWLWTGHINHDGYGIFNKQLAHRWAYRHFTGPVPDGLELDHLCRVRGCVNPEHLEAVTHGTNMLRGDNKQRTRCVHGHEYTEENTRLYKGKRSCRICRKENQMARPLMVSCYPQPWVHVIVGNGSADWNKAIENWAMVVADAAVENAETFTKAEWNYLADRLNPVNMGRNAEIKLPSHYERPGEFLAALVPDAPVLAGKLAELNYTHAWAVLKALEWRRSLDQSVAQNKDKWWLPSFWEEAVAALAD